MAFLNRISGVLRQTVNKHMNMEFSASNTSLYQAIRSMSSSKLFVGGLSYGTDEMSLREAFSQHGEVVEARIIMDRETGRSKGFGFVTYTSSDEASGAIQALDGQDLHGRRIRVNYATEKPRTGGFRGGFGYGGGGGNYGGSGGYGNNSYGGPGGYSSGGYGNASTYGGAGGNFGGGDGYGNSSYGAGNFNSSGTGSYAGGASSFDGVYGGGGGGGGAPAGGDYNSGIRDDSGFATSGYEQRTLDGNQRETAAVAKDFGGDAVEGNYRDDNDAPDSYANTRG